MRLPADLDHPTALGAPLASRLASARGVRLGLHAAVAALFLAFSLLMTWPLGHGLRHHLVSTGDPAFQTWTLAWDLHALRTDPRHIFDANIFYPYHNTLAYSDHLFGQAAVIAPLLLATGNAILADNVSLLLAFAASGFAMYLLVLDLTGSRMAGIVAGFAYAFAPMRMAHVEHLHLVSAEWLPLAVLTARRALLSRSWRWAAALGAVLLLQGLFGVYYFYFMLVLLLFVVAVYVLARRDRSALLAVGRLAACCAVAVTLLLPTLLPYQKVHAELGIERTEREVAKWSADLDNYRAVPETNVLLGGRMSAAYAPDLERELSPGLLIVPLAMIGLFNRRRGWERALLLTVAMGSIVLSLGPVWTTHSGRELWLPYRLFYDVVPGFRSIRVPARLGLLALVGLAGLAGLGVDLLLRGVRQLPLGRRGQLASLALVPLILLGGMRLEEANRLALDYQLPATAAEADAPEYQWMAAHPAPAIEFPLGEGLISTAWPNFWSLFHWNPVVNGYSGIAPPGYYPLRDFLRDFPSAATIHLLQGMGVRTVVYHARSSDPGLDAATLQRIAAFPQLRQVVAGPDYVFTLAADPWLWDLVAAVPAGAPVDLPQAEREVPTFAMLAAILQRQGHTVYGQGTIDYWRLPPAPRSVCFAVAPSGATLDPDRHPSATLVAAAGGLSLYRSGRCGS